MSYKKTIIFSIFSLVAINIANFFHTTKVLAADTMESLNLFGFDSLVGDGNSALGSITDFLINASYGIAVLVVVWGGYKFFIGAVSGDQEAGKKTIQAGVIGFALILMADQITNVVQGTFMSNGFSASAVTAFIRNILNVFVPLAGAFAVLALVWGGYLMMSGGFTDQYSEKYNKGKEAIKMSIIGFIVVLLAATIVQAIDFLLPK